MARKRKTRQRRRAVAQPQAEKPPLQGDLGGRGRGSGLRPGGEVIPVVFVSDLADEAADGVPLTVEGGGSGESPC